MWLLTGFVLVGSPQLSATTDAAAVQKAAATQESTAARARRLLATGQADAAEQNLWPLLQANHDDSEALILLGEVRISQKRFAEAEALLRRGGGIVTTTPATTTPATLAPATTAPATLAAEAHAGVAQALEGQGKAADALPEWREAVRLAPSHPAYAIALASAYRQQGQCAQALAALATLPKAKSPFAAVPIRAGCLLATGRVTEARSLSSQVQAPQANTAALDLAQTFLDAHQPGAAEATLAGALGRPGAPSRVWQLAGSAAEQEGHTATALQHYRRAVQKDPSNAEATLSLGALLHHQGKTAEALPLLERATLLAPDSIPAFRELLSAALRLGRNDLVRAASAKLYQLSPGNADDIYLAGAGFLTVGSFQAAIEAFTRYLLLKPDDARAELALGTAYRQRTQLGEAETHLTRSLSLDPTQAETGYQLAEVYLTQNKTDAARQLLRKNVAAFAQHAPTLAALGKLDVQSGDYADAAGWLERAVALAPANPETHYQLSLAYKRLGKEAASQEQAKLFQQLRTAQHREQNAGESDSHPPM